MGKSDVGAASKAQGSNGVSVCRPPRRSIDGVSCVILCSVCRGMKFPCLSYITTEFKSPSSSCTGGLPVLRAQQIVHQASLKTWVKLPKVNAGRYFETFQRR